MSTEVVPVEPVEPVQPESVAAEPPRRRRGPIIALIVVAAVLVLGVIAFVVAEAFAKNYARDYVREKVIAVLGLSDDAEVDVDLGSGSIIVQALAGRVDTVDVDVPQVAFGELSGAVRFHAEGVPLDETAAVDVLRIDFAIGADDLAALGGDDASTAPNFEFADGEVTLNSEFSLFGATIPLGLSLEPSAADGALVLTPTSVTIGSETFEAGSDDDSFLGSLVAGLLQPQTLCIASSVPQALVLADASVDDAELVLAFRGDGASFGGPELSTPGTCPPA